jgi:hypothetical protein
MSSGWLLLALSACGGGHDRSSSEQQGPPPRGTLVGVPSLVATLPAATLLAQLSAANPQLLALSGAPVCDVAIYHVRYTTVGGANEATEASAGLMIPTGGDAKCHDARPIVLYAHGTSTDRNFNIVDSQSAEGLLMLAVFASQGYTVVAPNYAGYDTSTLGYHPYLVADQQSKDMIDALTAARKVLPLASGLNTRDDGRLFVTGYSQGGFVAMATQRAMQSAGMTVTASVPMSGPYALAAFGDAVFEGEVSAGAPVFVTFLITAYQKSYGGIYTSTGDAFETQYASGIESLLPSTPAAGDLYSTGKLPRNALFSATPPDPAFAAMTPATTPANLAPTFARGFGAGNLITNNFRLKFLQDAQVNPDGGWPTTTTAVPAASPGFAFRKAFKDNDLRTWTPTAPTLLCGGNADPTVLWLNTQLMQSYWSTRAPASASIGVLDVDSAAASGDPYANLKNQFAIAKAAVAASAIAQGATDGGASAIADAYHSQLVAPFCLAAARSFIAAR